jgi:integrase
MASLYHDPDSDFWFLRLHWAGRRHNRSLRTKDEARARARLQEVQELEELVRTGRLMVPADADVWLWFVSGGRTSQRPDAPAPTPGPETLQALLTTYRGLLPADLKLANTRKTEEIHFQHLLRLLGPTCRLSTLKVHDLQRYINARAAEPGPKGTIQAKTIRMELDSLKACWNWVRAQGLLAFECPTRGLKFPRVRELPPFQTRSQIEAALAREPEASPRRQKDLWDSLFLLRPELEAVLALIRSRVWHSDRSGWLYPLVALAIYTGLRKSELLRSRLEDFRDGPQGTTLVVRELKKRQGRDSTRHVPLPVELLRLWRDEWLPRHPGGAWSVCRWEGRELNPNTVQDALRVALQGTDWAPIRGWHVFRHSFISLLAASGRADREIQALAGHLKAETTRRYTHLTPTTLSDAVRGIWD